MGFVIVWFVCFFFARLHTRPFHGNIWFECGERVFFARNFYSITTNFHCCCFNLWVWRRKAGLTNAWNSVWHGLRAKQFQINTFIKCVTARSSSHFVCSFAIDLARARLMRTTASQHCCSLLHLRNYRRVVNSFAKYQQQRWRQHGKKNEIIKEMKNCCCCFRFGRKGTRPSFCRLSFRQMILLEKNHEHIIQSHLKYQKVRYAAWHHYIWHDWKKRNQQAISRVNHKNHVNHIRPEKKTQKNVVHEMESISFSAWAATL